MVTLYTKDNCRPCKMTKRELNKHGIEYAEINLSEHPEETDALIEKGYMSSPVVITEKGEGWAGFMPTKIKELALASV